MLSNNQIKHFSSLRQKKFRKANQLFLAEGEKIVRELMLQPGFLSLNTLIASENFLKKTENIPAGITVLQASAKDIQRISSLNTGNEAIIAADIPEYAWEPDDIRKKISFAYEEIRDPGNLGTIIRTCDWFGVENIFLSHGSVDIYNPKVIQSSMGSISRVKVHYVEFSELLSPDNLYPPDFSTMATVLDGISLFEQELGKNGIVFFGNESKGLSPWVASQCDKKIFIPGHPENSGAESLNLGISTGIMSFELFKRKFIQNGS